MNRVSLILLLAGLYVALLAGTAIAQSQLERDILKTSAGDLEITFIGHGTLIFGFGGKIIHVDPYGKLADYAKLPKADLILITHEHRDHLDLDALTPIRTEQTIVVLPEVCAAKVPGSTVTKHGDVRTVLGVELQAVTWPAATSRERQVWREQCWVPPFSAGGWPGPGLPMKPERARVL